MKPYPDISIDVFTIMWYIIYVIFCDGWESTDQDSGFSLLFGHNTQHSGHMGQICSNRNNG